MTLNAYIVEDDPVMLDSLKTLLEASGDVKVVGSATQEMEAVMWLVSHPDSWSLLIIDYVLAAGNGLRVLSSCRVRGPGQHAVMLTAHATRDLRKKCLDIGADAVMDKVDGLQPLLDKARMWRRSADRAGGSAPRLQFRTSSTA